MLCAFRGRVIHDARVAVMTGIYLGTFARSTSCAEDMKDFKCQRQSELAFIASLLGLSNRWVWLRLYNMPELNFTRPTTPVVG